MSKKRGRAKQQREVKASSGVPVEEILAEGSGPHGEESPAVSQTLVAAEAGDATDGGDVIEASDLLEAVQAIEGGDLAAGEPEGEAVSDEVLEAAAASAELSADLAADLSADLSGELADDVATGDPAADAEMLADGAETDPAAIADPADADAIDGDLDPEAVGAAALPTSAASMDSVQLKQLLEALIFASDKPITVQRLRQLTRVSDTKRLEQTLVEITADYEHRGLILQQVSGGFQFRTRPQFSVWVQQLIQGRPVRLSRAQLETLAIIAYRQPITRPEIDDIRGVDSSATLKLLLDRALIRVLGKKEEVGRPMLYGTTKEFLDFFSLGDLRELPTLREYSELSDESRKVMSARLGISMDDPDGGSDGGSTTMGTMVRAPRVARWGATRAMAGRATRSTRAHLPTRPPSLVPTSQARMSCWRTRLQPTSRPPSCWRTTLAPTSRPPSCWRTTLAPTSRPPSCWRTTLAPTNRPPSCWRTTLAPTNRPPSCWRTTLAPTNRPPSCWRTTLAPTSRPPSCSLTRQLTKLQATTSTPLQQKCSQRVPSEPSSPRPPRTMLPPRPCSRTVQRVIWRR
ncbi:MAG: SMC-Scp complex subunit ScpB [Myxococcales bacterium]|nr:SMC-Scp complex subunit ScpB [Myxococcales bacterium]